MTNEEKYELNKNRWEYLQHLTKDEKKVLGLSVRASRAYYKCKTCGEQKVIQVTKFKTRETTCDNGCHGYSSNCNKVIIGVNDLATTHPHVVQYLTNKNDRNLYRGNSKKYIKVMCPQCKDIKNMAISNLTTHGISCRNCNGGISYPERFMNNVLKQLEIEYERQMPIDGCLYRYDFYIPSLNMIIETHGGQHYEGSGGWSTYEEIHERDIDKWMLAQLKFKGNLEYCVIDCRKSNASFIRESILQSSMKTFFNLDTINWEDVEKETEKSLLMEINNYYNNNSKDIRDISNEFNISIDSVRRYLKKGATLNIGNYDSNTALKERYDKAKQKVVYVNLDEMLVVKIFESISECSKELQYGKGNIIILARGEGKRNNDHTIQSQKLGGLRAFYYFDSKDWERDKHLYTN